MKATKMFVAFAIALGTANAALAHEQQMGTLLIEHPWARPTVPGATVSAGYLEIQNTGEASDYLIGAEFTGAGMVQIHQMDVQDDVMRMSPLEGPLELPPGEWMTLQPGSLHLMLMQLDGQLVEDSTVAGVLIFQEAGRVEVEFTIEPLTKADEQAESRTAHGEGDMAHSDSGGSGGDSMGHEDGDMAEGMADTGTMSADS